MLNQVEAVALLKFRRVFFQAVFFAKTNLTYNKNFIVLCFSQVHFLDLRFSQIPNQEKA